MNDTRVVHDTNQSRVSFITTVQALIMDFFYHRRHDAARAMRAATMK